MCVCVCVCVCVFVNSTNIPPIMIINRIYETQNLLSLWLVFFLAELRTYQHPCRRDTFSVDSAFRMKIGPSC